jgi:hypothetical protein
MVFFTNYKDIRILYFILGVFSRVIGTVLSLSICILNFLGAGLQFMVDNVFLWDIYNFVYFSFG